jgi:hypothetical protein
VVVQEGDDVWLNGDAGALLLAYEWLVLISD